MCFIPVSKVTIGREREREGRRKGRAKRGPKGTAKGLLLHEKKQLPWPGREQEKRATIGKSVKKTLGRRKVRQPKRRPKGRGKACRQRIKINSRP